MCINVLVFNKMDCWLLCCFTSPFKTVLTRVSGMLGVKVYFFYVYILKRFAFFYF